MKLGNFLSELKRRNVYKIAVAYSVVGWLLMQIATQIFPFLEIPTWAIRLVILSITIGFPIALILAWAYESTPEGIKRTTNTSASGNEASHAWIYVAAIAGALALGLFFLGRYTASRNAPSLTGPPPAATVSPPQKSIAVLPFQSLSEEKANAYFAEGIQDEILTRLAKIADLKVISRTSTQRYESKPENLSDIAKQLGVENILEGSVQRAGDQVRVNVQLINAATDSHIWADTYDRKLTDIFSVETEIARRIADSLQAKLTGREEQALTAKPTNNPEAYDAYLHGLASEAREIYGVYPLQDAIGFYEQAVNLDPAFALAWSRLALANLYWYLGVETTEARLDRVKLALEKAQALQPNAPETLLALGTYQARVPRDYELAKTTFALVAKILPSNSEVPNALARIALREGRWDESIAYYEKALLLDPRNREILTQAADGYATVRRFPDARRMYDRALEISPSDPELMAVKAAIYQAEGDLQEAASLLSNVNAQTPSYEAVIIKIFQLILEHRCDEVVRLLQARVTQFHFGSEVEKGIFQTMLAFYQRVCGDAPGAKVTAEQARLTLEPLRRDQPKNEFIPLYLSRTYALLGNKAAALDEANHAVSLQPKSTDVVSGPGLEENMALVKMILGENSPMISTLARLRDANYFDSIYGVPITSALLRLDPTWDPLRSDPTFQKLCEEKPH